MTTEFASKELPPQKPGLLPVLLILSYINTIFAILLYFLMFVMALAVRGIPYEEFVSKVEEVVSKNPMPEAVEMVERLSEIFYLSGVAWSAILLLRSIARLIGVIMMHRRRATGFTVYAAAQIIGLFAPLLVLPWDMFGIFGPLMTVLMVVLYGTQRKWLDRDPLMAPMV